MRKFFNSKENKFKQKVKSRSRSAILIRVEREHAKTATAEALEDLKESERIATRFMLKASR